jgi:hypothetical protein
MKLYNNNLIVYGHIRNGDKYDKKCIEILDWVNREWK